MLLQKKSTLWNQVVNIPDKAGAVQSTKSGGPSTVLPTMSHNHEKNSLGIQSICVMFPEEERKNFPLFFKLFTFMAPGTF